MWDVDRAARVARATFARAEAGVVFGGERNAGGAAWVFNLAARGRVLCVALSDGTVRLLDARSLDRVGALEAHAERGASALAVAAAPEPAAPLLATADTRGAVLLWDMRRLGAGPLAEAANPGAVHSLAFVVAGVAAAPTDALLVVSGGRDGVLRAHDARTLAVADAAPLPNAVLCVAAAPDAAAPRLASGGGTGKTISDAGISLWRLETTDAAGGRAGETQRRIDDLL